MATPTAKNANAKTTAAKKPPMAKPVLVAVAIETASASTGEPAAAPAAANTALKLKEFIERVVAATGAKKKGVKEIVEATLNQLGEALQKGETLNLPAFGKARVARQTAVPGGHAMTLKLRRVKPDPDRKRPAKEPLAEDGEAS